MVRSYLELQTNLPILDFCYTCIHMQRTPIAIVGAGGLGREVRFLLELLIEQGAPYDFVGFFDDGIAGGTYVNGSKVVGPISMLNEVMMPHSVVLAVGKPQLRKAFFDRLHNPLLSFPTLAHPTAILGEKAFVHIGDGCIITAAVVMTTNISIGDFVLINNASQIGHDSIVGNFVSIMPGANLSGHVHLEDEVYIGTGASLINGVRVGAGSVIGAGAAVVDAIPSGCTAVGVPAKPLDR